MKNMCYLNNIILYRVENPDLDEDCDVLYTNGTIEVHFNDYDILELFDGGMRSFYEGCKRIGCRGSKCRMHFKDTLSIHCYDCHGDLDNALWELSKHTSPAIRLEKSGVGEYRVYTLEDHTLSISGRWDEWIPSELTVAGIEERKVTHKILKTKSV